MDTCPRCRGFLYYDLDEIADGLTAHCLNCGSGVDGRRAPTDAEMHEYRLAAGRKRRRGPAHAGRAL